MWRLEIASVGKNLRVKKSVLAYWPIYTTNVQKHPAKNILWINLQVSSSMSVHTPWASWMQPRKVAVSSSRACRSRSAKVNWPAVPVAERTRDRSEQRDLLAGRTNMLDVCLIFHRFLIDFELPNIKKSLKIYWFYTHFCIIALSKLTSVFVPILVPTCFHFPSKIHQNHFKNQDQEPSIYWSIFGWIFYPF